MNPANDGEIGAIVRFADETSCAIYLSMATLKNSTGVFPAGNILDSSQQF